MMYSVEDFEKYSKAFMKGYNIVFYSDSEDDREIPKLDYSNLLSIAEVRGFEYGEYCEMAGLLNDIKPDHFSAVINKSFARSCDEYEEHKHDKEYITYKSGFVAGKSDIQLKISENNENFNVIPEIEDNNFYSIGYYDGYCYYLNEYLNKDTELEELEETKEVKPVRIEELTRELFNQRIGITPSKKI